MLPTSTSNKSFTQQKRNPPGHKPPVARSSSFLGTIKNIVTAPLAWFAHDDDFEDTRGKRRRLEQNGDVGAATEDGVSRNKRMRVNSPEREDQLYLDPPEQIFQQPRSAPSGSDVTQSPSRPRYPAPISRSTSVTTPSNNVHRMSRNSRHTVSPLRTSFTQADIISRTMSMDPPTRHSHARDITMTPYRDGNRYSMSVPRDISMSPTRTPFLMRTSLTPQPSGSNFGPPLQKQQQHPSEPPSIEELMANPKFVRPPESSHQRNLSREPVVTLGSLVDSQRSTRSPSRPHSSLLFGPQGSVSDTSSVARPVNAAEKALHELDIYKTPLLPSRLRGSTTIPDIFKPKPRRSHTPIFMRSDKNEKPKLGKTKDKKQEVNGTKPYAGEGGLKKMLARRKQEEEEERQQEKVNAMDDGELDEEEIVPTKKSGRPYVGKPTDTPASQPEKRYESVPAIPPLPKFDPSFDRTANNREQSSLRVGRTRTSRNHISRPTTRSKNRFSAAYEDDDDEDQMLEEKSADVIALEEAARKVPAFRVPDGFSFAKETPPIQHDLTTAKEPPIATLPFSLTKAIAPQPAPAPSVSKEQEQPPKPTSFSAQPSVSSTTSQPPSISLTTPTPEPVKTAVTDPPTTAPGIPNFFANSSALSKPAPADGVGSGIPNFFANSTVLGKPISVTPPPAASLNVPDFANSAALNKPESVIPQQASLSSAHVTPTKDAENPLWEGEKEKRTTGPEETKSLPLGDLANQASTSPLFRASSASTNNTSVFGAGSEMNKPLFGPSLSATPAKEVQPAPTASMFSGIPPVKTEPIASPSSFSAPAKSSESAQQFPPTKTSDSTIQAPVEAEKAPPLFGSAPISSFSGFNGLAPINTEPKPAFTFGQPASGASTPIEAPKPTFGSESAAAFSFGQRPSSAPAADNKLSAASPFSFGAAPSTPPAGAEKKAPFVFGPSPVTAAPAGSSPFPFGPPSGSSNGTDVSHKPFSFGNAAAPVARPVTPKNEQEFRMEESPTRDMNVNGKALEVPKLTTSGFSFGATSAPSSATSLFGQNAQGGQSSSGPFSFGGPLSAPASNPFAKPEVKTESKGFTEFGQNTSSSAFSFDQKPGEISRAASSSGAFSFGQAPVAPATTSSFAFGAPPINSNPFSQTVPNTGSAPNSPSTFNQPTPFSFTSPTVTSNPFAFGPSQPASPANGNISLPQASGTPGGGFAFGQTSGSTQVSSSFQAQPTTAPSAGGSLFTIGSAPPPAPSGGNGRAIKKLPTRRMGKR